MIRLALPKSRNLVAALAALRAGGIDLDGIDSAGRELRLELPDEKLEVLLLKDADLPLYVAHGIADCGIVGTDVLGETEIPLLMPLRLTEGRCRLSLIGLPGSLPRSGSQVRLATKFPNLARRLVASKPWGAEILKLSGSIELAPLLDLAEIALDIVQTGQTLRDNGLVELEVVEEVAPAMVVNGASYQRLRGELNDLFQRLEQAGVAS